MYRSRWQPDQFFSLQARTVRWLTLAALLAYPAGALTAALTPDESVIGVLGRMVATISALLGLLVIGSHTHQLVAGKPAELDEYQLHLRHRALSGAYGILSALLVGAVVYLSFASDFGMWIPTDGDQWTGVFWGAFLYATLLPTAVLVWANPGSDGSSDEGAE